MAAPKIIPYDVELRSVNPIRSFDRPKAYTNDLNSVEFQFKVLDMTSTELTTATAVTLVYMRDGSFFANPSTDVSRVGNVFSYLLKENEGNHAGVAQIQLVVTVDGMELASQLFDFEIINGLETKVAQEVMIYDWTILTRDARAYIDQFVADEELRAIQFGDAQTQRNTDFVNAQNQRTEDFNAAQTSRSEAFGVSEAGRTTTFNASEAGRTTIFNDAEEARASGYDADHSRAGTDHTTAVNDHTLAGTDHTTAANDHTLAGTDHTRAEADHTRADADSATVAGFNTRLAAEETATANNKISAVKGKTFTDVDARLEDIETDGSLMATNLVTNGDFSNGTTDWSVAGTATVVNKELIFTNLAASSTEVTRNVATVVGNRYYVRVKMQSNSNQDGMWFVNASAPVTSDKKLHSGSGAYESLSAIVVSTASSYSFRILDSIRSGDIASNPVKLQYAIAIDLTAAFGAGNEPTAEQMDGIMAKFENSWFDGTKNLFQAKASLNKLMALDARTEFEMRNAVVNGDFSSDTANWTVANAPGVSVDSTIFETGPKSIKITTAETSAYLHRDIVTKAGNKIYVAMAHRLTSYTSGVIYLRVAKIGTYTMISDKYGDTSALNTWIRSSNIVTLPSDSAGFRLMVGSAGNSTYTVNIDDVLAIDLTAAFGAGKEPTAEQMDRLMSRFPNSWFDGVKPIQTIETLYQEKANKVQEAWITPTLINGWTEVSGYPVRYMKDEMGFVHLKGKVTGGTLGSRAFTLPTGYRILGSVVKFALIGSTSTSCVVQVQSDGAVTVISGTNTDVCLDGIPPFKID